MLQCEWNLADRSVNTLLVHETELKIHMKRYRVKQPCYHITAPLPCWALLWIYQCETLLKLYIHYLSALLSLIVMEIMQLLLNLHQVPGQLQMFNHTLHPPHIGWKQLSLPGNIITSDLMTTIFLFQVNDLVATATLLQMGWWIFHLIWRTFFWSLRDIMRTRVTNGWDGM